jgi:hypothetical protein
MRNSFLLIALCMTFSFSNAFAEEAEEPKAEESEEPKAEESEEPKAEESEEPKAEESEEPKAEESEEPKAEEAEEPKAEEAEEPKAEETKAEDKKKPELTDAEKKAKSEKALKKAAKRKSKYPISGSIATSYTGNHANFVESNGDFGTQIFGLGGTVSYKAHKHLRLTTGVNSRKSIVNDYFSAGSASKTNEQPWEIGDLSLSMGFGKLYTIPVVDISISSGATFALPLSRTSRSFGIITASSLNTNLSWKLKKVRFGLGVRLGANVLESPTLKVDCVRAPDVCRIAGSEVGMPLSRFSYGSSFSVSTSFFEKKVTIRASYGVASGVGAVEFEDDEFTSQYAQTGSQLSALGQSFSTNVSYAVLKKTSLSLTMSTGGPFYTNDNQAWRFPLFDTESNLHHRTSYTLSVSQSF